MENNKKYWFFGSKLNTVLLLILIILMVIALRWMSNDKDKYFPIVNKDQAQKVNQIEIEGNKGDLVSFSIKPGQEVSGKVFITGVIQGGYFFEGNFGLSVIDANKKDINIKYDVTKKATSDWMTSGPVSIQGSIDFTNLPKGKAYIVITADDPRDHPEKVGTPTKEILIPIVIK